jgi:DNA-binding response OmpR family regulator
MPVERPSKLVFVVEDDKDSRGFIYDVLDGEGYMAYGTGRLSTARKILARPVSRGNMGLIICDNNMGDGLGSEFLEEVRALGYRDPFVLTSASFSETKRTESQGIITVQLPKPFNLGEFIELTSGLMAPSPEALLRS